MSAVRNLRSLLHALAIVVAANSATAAILPSVKSRDSEAVHERAAGVPADLELERAGAIVGKITIVVSDLFDTELEEEDTSLFRLANRLHSETRDKTIRHQLLFESGHVYQGRLLNETARLLRSQRYLRDAWIRAIAWHDGEVDVEVEVRDVWTLNPGLSFGRKGGNNSTGFEIEELNLFGTGTQIALARKSNVDRDSTRFVFRDPQLGRTRWGIDAEWEDNSDGLLHALQFQRPFYALDSRWSAGAAYSRRERIESRYDLSAITDQFAAETRTSSLWMGWSRGLRDAHTTRYTVGYSVEESRFDSILGANPTRLLPEDRKLAYPWVAVEWAEDDYRTERDRDQIGRTEDVALGLQVRLRLGYLDPALGADRSGVITSFTAAHGWQLSARQTLQIQAEASGRLESGTARDALLGTAIQYYFRQSPRRVLYLGLSTLDGRNLDTDRQVLLGGDNGLRGYPLRYQSGTSRWLFTAEQRLFSNWYPFRLFNVGGAVFYDMGSVSGVDPLGSAARGVLHDIGIGLRLGNGRTALGNVIHIDVAVPLDRDAAIDDVQFLVETKRSF